MTEEEIGQQQGKEIQALVNSFLKSGRSLTENPQFDAEIKVIVDKYNALRQQLQQQQPTQQQTTTQDTGALANVGTNLTDEEIQNRIDTAPMPDTQPKMLYGGDYSLETFAGGQPQMLYFTGSDGKSYVKRYAEDEFVYGAPPSGVSLTLTSIIAEDRNDNKFKKDVDPTQFQYGGKQTPEQADAAAKEAAREPGYESGGGGLFYEYNGREYYTPDNTGQSIPVGSTNITRDPTQLSYIEKVADPQIGDDEGTFIKRDKDPSTYTQPVLTKTFQGYEPVTGMYSDVEGITPEQYAQLSPAEKLKLAQSDVPTASTDFKDFFDMGSGRFDLGGFFGMDIDPTTGTSGLVLSNPPSNQFNLEKFFNQTEAMGTQNFLRSQSTDVLNDIILSGNFFNALMGRNFELPDDKGMYYDKIYQPGYQAGFDEDGNYQVTGDAIQGFDMGQLEDFFNDLATNKNPTTGDTMYSDTAFSTDPFNISGGDDSNALQYNYAYSQRPLTAQAVRAYKGGLGPYANVQYLTRYGYNPEIGDEILRYDEASGVYFDPVTGLPIKPERLEGFALSDPETVELQGTESVYRGQMTTNPVTGEKLYYDAEGNPVTEEQYQLFTEPMETGVT
jgi:hypothetical protein